jgi:site-specific DNA-methyltransferase (adenine-specific)
MPMQNNYNPDVLSCLANLSNDEVFTPPGLVNQMLDMLPAALWKDKNTKFLDPVSKTGVFLREIAQRLIVGLEEEIPDLQKRINHIYQNQIYGIAITSLTALLSRRSVYCSKTANGKYSVASNFKDEVGNIVFDQVKHSWENGKCRYCNASQVEYDRSDLLETHAYQFIHTNEPAKLFNNMKFDVIIGNPPYQLSDGGDRGGDVRARGGAIPLYNQFVVQAKKMMPRYLSMIIPSRWFTGGRGLDAFRDEMLSDKRLRRIVDYPVSSECFPGVEIKGGVCYFLWDRDNPGDCEVKTLRGDKSSVMERPLLEKGSDIFIRFNESIEIMRKVLGRNEDSFSRIVSTQKPFGLRTFFQGKKSPFDKSVKLYTNDGVSYIEKSDIVQNLDWLNKPKVFISMAYGAGEDFPHQIINKPIYGGPNTCCTETYLVIGPFLARTQAENVMTYIRTRFFRFMVLLRKNTQHAAKGVYAFVPMQNFDEAWTDEKLYKKYKLTGEEVEFIESMVRPMSS